MAVWRPIHYCQIISQEGGNRQKGNKRSIYSFQEKKKITKYHSKYNWIISLNSHTHLAKCCLQETDLNYTSLICFPVT